MGSMNGCEGDLDGVDPLALEARPHLITLIEHHLLSVIPALIEHKSVITILAPHTPTPTTHPLRERVAIDIIGHDIPHQCFQSHGVEQRCAQVFRSVTSVEVDRLCSWLDGWSESWVYHSRDLEKTSRCALFASTPFPCFHHEGSICSKFSNLTYSKEGITGIEILIAHTHTPEACSQGSWIECSGCCSG